MLAYPMHGVPSTDQRVLGTLSYLCNFIILIKKANSRWENRPRLVGNSKLKKREERREK